jgi:hypothetical protein
MNPENLTGRRPSWQTGSICQESSTVTERLERIAFFDSSLLGVQKSKSEIQDKKCPKNPDLLLIWIHIH